MAILSSWLPTQRKVAIDLGTAYIRMASRELGLVTIPIANLPRPPLRDGVVADPYEVAIILRPLLGKAQRLGVGPNVAVGIPTSTNFKERKALHLAMCAAGAEHVEIVPEPQAAAIGAGLEVDLPYAHMVVDIGEGVTDCAVIRGGKILHAVAIRIGCGTLREQVRDGYRRRWGIELTWSEAEHILEEAGVGGKAFARNAGHGPPSAGISAGGHASNPAAIHAFVEPCVVEILSAINEQMRDIPHELGCEIIESGITLTGGGALLSGMSERLSIATSIKVTVPQNPLDAVVKGLRHMLDA